MAQMPVGSMEPTGYTVQLSETIDDPTWDAFVGCIPGGQHVQTSLWGRIKAIQGWRAVRIGVTRDADLIGGLQLLIRPIPLIGAAAYVTKGPLCSSHDPALLALILNQLNHVCRMYRVQYLIVQPANNCDWITGYLMQRGFRATAVEVAPTATILLDLSKSLDELLAQMQGPRRRGIQRSIREKITVREGTEADLGVFHRLHVMTSKRQQFDPFPLAYFMRMWEVLKPRNGITLLFSERHGEAISTLLLITFDDTVIAKVFGWSGMHSNCRPGEAVYWGAIRWAKKQGFRYFDFEGVDPAAACAVLNNRPLSEALQHTPTFFKFAYGGQVTLYPVAYDYVFNPLLRWIFRAVSPAIQHGSVLYQVAEHLRKRQSDSAR